MTPQPNGGLLVNKLILVVLTLILGCLAVLLYRVLEEKPAPLEQAATAEITMPLPETVESSPTGATVSSVTAAPPARPRIVTPTNATPPVAPASPARSLPDRVARSLPAPSVPPPAMPPAEAVAGIAVSPSVLRFVAQPTGSEMLIVGTATGHEWKARSVILGGFFETDLAWQADPSLQSTLNLGEGRTPPQCEVRIPVRTFKSQVAVGRSIMDDRLQKELKAARFPNLEFKLTEMKLQGEVPASGSPVTFDTKGRLAVAGVTNEVAFPVTMERSSADTLKFTGSCKTRMTAFGVEPPAFTVMGIGSKTGDEVTLTWTWRVGLTNQARPR